MINLFLGTYEHKIDPKGRLFLPKKLVEAIKDGEERQQFVLTMGLDECLYLFTRRGFVEHVQHLRQSPHGPQEYRRVMRGMGTLSVELCPDSQGRIHLPEELRKRASLDTDVVVLGAVDHVEIWDAAAWSGNEAGASHSTYLDKADGYFSNGTNPQGVES
ncbi:MAG TPA: cell division/cell wall cluster transcriptional repressor MraZ [Planctomycetota bacterium]